MNRVMKFLRKAPVALPVEKPPSVFFSGGRSKTSGKKPPIHIPIKKKWWRKKQKRKAAERSRKINRRKK